VAEHRADLPSVLLAEHEAEVAEMAARYLRRDGLRVRLVNHPDQTLAELTAGPDVAAVIDLTMPGLDPRRIRRALRTPVIFLVADLKRPRPRGLATRGDVAGARRWLARPFSPRHLVALVRDVLAQAAPSGPAPAVRSTAAGLRLDGESRTLVADAHRVSLTATEYALLAALMDHPGRVLSRRQLLAAAGRQAAGDRAADVYIAQLRAKIPAAAAIRTVRGSGYVLDRLAPDTGRPRRAIRGGQSRGHQGDGTTISGATVPTRGDERTA
jgi:two-component system response regulator MtrA